jgi:hypothetical protein
VTRLVGINHVALEVDDVEALAFYGRFSEFTLRRRSRGAAFIDIGDQFGRDHVLVASSARCSALFRKKTPWSSVVVPKSEFPVSHAVLAEEVGAEAVRRVSTVWGAGHAWSEKPLGVEVDPAWCQYRRSRARLLVLLVTEGTLGVEIAQLLEFVGNLLGGSS